MSRPSAEEFLVRLRAEAEQGGLGAGLFEFDARQDAGDVVQCLVPGCEQLTHTFVTAPAVAPQLRPPPHPAWLVPNFLWYAAWRAWCYVREASGDDAYERYLQHVARFHAGQRPMSRAEYFLYRQDQKWNRLSRCC